MLALVGGIVHFHPSPKLSSPHSRFLGTDPEPRPGLSSGHIPNSFSLPFNLFLTQNTNIVSGETYTMFKSPDRILNELKKAVGEEQTHAILEGKRKVVTSCGSGMTAGVLWLGLNLLGVKGVALYDEVRRPTPISSTPNVNQVPRRVGPGMR
jgi:thiosulfate/3-mercaptopyruvate sulfurtransferase